MNTESGIPVTGLYADEAPSGYIEPPTNTQFHSGVEPEMTLPAAWWNYFVNLFTNTNIKAKEDITAILAELNNALTGGGITPDPEATNQLLALLQKGSGSTVNADKVRDTTPGTRGLQYLAAAAVANIAPLILADLKTVDGTGSGLDSDLVRGTTPGARGLQYLAAAAVSNIAPLILSDLKTVDGPGSGLDADLLDGLQGSAYAKVNTATSPTETDLPVGSYLIVYGELVSYNANTTVTIRVSAEGRSYSISTSPFQLSGTWRTCGYAQKTIDMEDYNYYLVRRVA